MDKSFYPEWVQKRAESTSLPGRAHLKTDAVDSGTASTGYVVKSQFVKPGFIDTRYKARRDGDVTVQSDLLANEQYADRETEPQIRSVQTGLVPRVPMDTVWSQTAALDTVWSEAASPPYTYSRFTLATVTRQYLLLLLVLLAEYRTTWFYHVFSGLLIPISFIFLISAVGGVTGPAGAIYLLGGNMALSIVSGPVTFLVSKVGWGRQTKEFYYWVALPIPKLLLVLAIVSVALMFALPGLVGVYVFTNWLFGLSFSNAWALIPLIPLAVLPLAGIGALLGASAPNGQVANIMSNIVLIFVSILSPVMLPLEALPVPLRIVAQFMPTTYVADAFRAVLGGYPGTNLTFDIIILTLFSVVLLTFTYFRLDWNNT